MDSLKKYMKEEFNYLEIVRQLWIRKEHDEGKKQPCCECAAWL